MSSVQLAVGRESENGRGGLLPRRDHHSLLLFLDYGTSFLLSLPDIGNVGGKFDFSANRAKCE